MERKRQYSADEIREWVELLAKDPERDSGSLAGMRELVDMLKHFENMTNEDIAADVERFWSSA